MTRTTFVAALLFLTISLLLITVASPIASGGGALLRYAPTTAIPYTDNIGPVSPSAAAWSSFLPLIELTLSRPGVVSLAWTIEDVVRSPSLVIAPGERSLQLDDRSALGYASWTGSEWQKQVVDPSLSIAYLDRGSMDVKMATAAPLIDNPVGAAQHDPASLPDLTIEGMRIELETGGSCGFTSTQLGTRVRIANTGDADAGPFVLALNDEPYQIAAGLPAGSEAEYWFPNARYFMETVAIADATHLIAESNEDNNEMRQMLGVPTLPATCTPTVTPSPTPSATPSGTITPTPTPTPSHTPTLSPTPTPSPSPIATGDFWWRCDVTARDDSSGQPIAGAHVLVSAIGEDACTTDAQGGCAIRVLAHDTGRINLRVSAEGYHDFTVEYVGMFAPSWLQARLKPAPPTETPTETPTSFGTFTPTATDTPTIAAPPTGTPTTTTDRYPVWLPLLLRFPPAPV